MERLLVLNTLRLKGRADSDALAAAVGVPPEEAAAALAAVVELGLVAPAGKAFKLTAPGQEALAELLADERTDPPAFGAVYDAFNDVNGDFKALITDWQLRAGEPNDHTDEAYDAEIVRRLGDLHSRVVPVLDGAAVLLTRLAAYRARFESALSKVQAGEAPWISRPIIDSYHTVWFEFHEELIGAAGFTRAGEAAAGRAH